MKTITNIFLGVALFVVAGCQQEAPFASMDNPVRLARGRRWMTHYGYTDKLAQLHKQFADLAAKRPPWSDTDARIPYVHKLEEIVARRKLLEDEIISRAKAEDSTAWLFPGTWKDTNPFDNAPSLEDPELSLSKG